MKKLLGLTSVLLTTGLVAFAAPVTPTYTTFGTLSGATWGGTGNPNDAVAITTIVNGGDTVTLGLQAQGRYSNPPLANDGAGTFYATPGENYGNPATPTTPGTPSNYKGATWNFDYYISVNNSDFNNYTFQLLYGTDASSLVTMPFGPVLIAQADGSKSYSTVGGTTTAQDSENLDFSFLGPLIGFDPNANGQYSFELQALDGSGKLLGQSAIVVDVGTVPDAASTAWLLGLGFLSLTVFGFRQNRLAMAKQFRPQ